MPFFAYKLLFIAVALGLAVVAVLIVRQLLGKRPPKAPPPPREAVAAEAPKRKLPALGKKAAAPEPEPAEPPAPRRRQLQSFAEAERIAAEEAEPGLPTLPIAAEPEPEPEPIAVPEPEPVAPPVTADDADFGEVVLGRLEAAFEALQAGDITLGIYRERLLGAQAAVEDRIAALQAGADDGEPDDEELGAALAAQEAVRWCLDWAEEQEGLHHG